jgi:hypothetical protein
MAEQNSTTNDSMSAIRAEVEAFRLDPALCARDAVVAAAERFLALPVAAGREAERDTLVRNLLRDARAKIAAHVGNLVGGDAQRVRYALGPLAQPVPKPSEFERVAPTLLGLWGSAEHDLARRYLNAHRGQVGRIDERGFEVGGAFVTRRELRAWARPASFANAASWDAQFPKLPDEAAR